MANLGNDRRFLLVDSAIHDLFDLCDIVVTVNSGVGFEALLAGKQVVLTGKSDYNLAAVTAHSESELERILRSELHVDTDLRDRFIYHYFKNHTFDPLMPEDFEGKLIALLGL